MSNIMNPEDFGKAEIDAIENAQKRVENMLKVSLIKYCTWSWYY